MLWIERGYSWEFARINVALWVVACLAGGAALIGEAIIKHEQKS